MLHVNRSIRPSFCSNLVLRAAAPMVLLLLALVPKALAGGPRFVSGSGMWVVSQGVGWSGTQLPYYTDPGDLNASVTHAQADAMVAAAAAVWNVPTSSLSLAKGGTLAEHVTGSNTYFDGANFVFPADAGISNEAAVPLPVIYDTDGSLIDLLLGSGASDPSGCRQTAVVESVDDIQADNYIHHALLVLNGRCVGGAPEQLLQMQYQLARAFGRVLGVAWSQTNDNVFTAANTVTADQETYWPLMHPVDVLCGNYSYQCMPNPFTLRPDDLSGLASVYLIPANHVPAGKQASGAGAAFLFTSFLFPTGQGMDWVNFTATRKRGEVLDDYQIVSSVTGTYFQQSLPSPILGAPAANEGSSNVGYETLAFMRVVPLDGVATVYSTSEAINPLYFAEFALGPYVRPPVAPSGSSQTWEDPLALPAPDTQVGISVFANDAASSCSPGNDGVEAAPAPLDASGWQAGLLCGWGHNSWWSATVRAGRSWTLEVTATDETGRPTTAKAQPVVGLWNTSDPTGTLPTLASAAAPFNSMALGVTQIGMPASATDTSVRFAVGDQFGAGRPDFTYGARLLYADSVSPATVGAGGGTITITGTGFRQGNLVQINGTTAAVTSWTATQIVAVAPPFPMIGSAVGTPLAVSVIDASTNGSTTIANALVYTSAPDLLEVVSAPTSLETGVAAATPFAVRILAYDGSTPVAGVTVQFAVSAGSAVFAAGGSAATYLATSDANGLVQVTVIGGAAGPVTLTATEVSETVLSKLAVDAVTTNDPAVTITLNDTDPMRSVTLSSASAYVAAGSGGAWTLQLDAVQDGSPAVGAPITWMAGPGLVMNTTGGPANASGTGALTVTALALPSASVTTVTGCAWATVCASWTVYGVDSSQWQVVASTGIDQNVTQAGSLGAVSFVVTDAAGHSLSGAPVTIHQRVLAWEGPCPATGACAAAPVLTSAQSEEMSDSHGTLALTPLQLPGIPQTVEVAVSSGTQGFATITLVKSPAPPNDAP